MSDVTMYRYSIYCLIVNTFSIIRSISITIIIIITTTTTTTVNRSMRGWQSAYENASTWNRWSLTDSETATSPLHIFSDCEERFIGCWSLSHVTLDFSIPHGTYIEWWFYFIVVDILVFYFHVIISQKIIYFDYFFLFLHSHVYFSFSRSYKLLPSLQSNL